MAVAVVSSALVFLRGDGDRGELEMWVFNAEHQALFQPVADEWNLDPELPSVDVHLVGFWDDAVYDEPMAYYSDQAIGRLLIEMAGDVPYRSSSVHYSLAVTELANALNRLNREARRMGSPDRGTIRAMIERELDVAQDNVLHIVARNIFQASE